MYTVADIVVSKSDFYRKLHAACTYADKVTNSGILTQYTFEDKSSVIINFEIQHVIKQKEKE